MNESGVQRPGVERDCDSITRAVRARVDRQLRRARRRGVPHDGRFRHDVDATHLTIAIDLVGASARDGAQRQRDEHANHRTHRAAFEARCAAESDEGRFSSSTRVGAVF